MAFHHALVKSLATAGLVAVASEDGETVSIVMEGVAIATGPIAEVKALAAEAKTTVAEDDFDLETFAEGINEPVEDAEEEGESGPLAKTMAKYRARYADHNDSNGDPLALALRAALTRLGDKKGDAQMDAAALQAVADQNGIPVPAGRNPGHSRMILGNILRGALRRGTAIHIGKTTIEPTPEAKAARAERMAKDKAKHDAVAQPKQTKEEKQAKAKARREAAKAEKAKANEAEAKQIAA